MRLFWLTYHPAAPAWDGAIYARTAVRIAHGLGFIDSWNNRPPFRPTAFYPVGYPATLAAAYVIFGIHPWVAALLNLVSAAICTWIVVLLAERSWGRACGHIAGGLFAFSPGAIAYTSAFMTEPLSAALLALAILCALHHHRTGHLASAIAAGLLLGYGGLVRPPALVVAPFLALGSAPRMQWRSVASTLAAVGFATCAVVLPWTARNCRQLDGCALVSLNGGSNLWIGADPAAVGGYRDLRPGEGCDGVIGEVAKDRCYGAMAIAKIERNPLTWLALAPLKVGQLLGYENTPVSYLRAATHGAAFQGTSDRWFRAMTAYHRVLLGLALLALLPFVTRRRSRLPTPVVLTVVSVGALVAVHIVFFGVDRYHFVFTPLLCMIASGAFRRPDPVRAS